MNERPAAYDALSPTPSTAEPYVMQLELARSGWCVSERELAIIERCVCVRERERDRERERVCVCL